MTWGKYEQCVLRGRVSLEGARSPQTRDRVLYLRPDPAAAAELRALEEESDAGGSVEATGARARGWQW